MNSFKKIIFFTGFVIHFVQDVFSQNSIPVISTPFKVTSNDNNDTALRYKLPEFICEGILINSSIRLVKIVDLDKSFSGISFKTVVQDSTINKKYKAICDSLQVKFFIDGEISISNDKFYITVNATDFKNKPVFYQSKLSPLSDFQKIIDSACNDLNIQFNSIITVERVFKKISVSDFRIISDQGVYYSSGNGIYAPDFPSRFLANNLKNSKWYSVLPYVTGSEFNLKSPDKIFISGQVKFEKKNYCVISPVIYFPGGKQSNLPNVSDLVQNRDQLQSRVLTNIQSFLDLYFTGNVTGLNNLPDANFKAPDYRKAFELAIKENNLSLANYYAARLSNFMKEKYRAELMMGIVEYKQDHITSALKHITSYFIMDTIYHMDKYNTDQEANYYAGLSHVKIGRYQEAKSYFAKLDTNNISCDACRDVFFQKGYCLYYQDSTEEALEQFKKQVASDDTIRPETYNYIAACARYLNNLPDAESKLLKLYHTDPTNITYLGYLIDFYNKYAQIQFDSTHYDSAYSYYRKSYTLDNKSFESVVGLSQSIIMLNKSDDNLNEVIQQGIEDKVFSPNEIYLTLAAFCSAQVDSNNEFIPRYLEKAIYILKKLEQSTSNILAEVYLNMGINYFVLGIPDSAEIYYKEVKQMQPQNPLNYFDLAELQVTQLKADSAMVTLNDVIVILKDVYDRVKSDKPLSIQDDFYIALYYFYMIECKLLKNQNYDKEKKGLKDIIYRNKKGKEELNLFPGWSFQTFYNWTLKNQHTGTLSKEFLDNLCLVLEYSDERDLPCPSNQK